MLNLIKIFESNYAISSLLVFLVSFILAIFSITIYKIIFGEETFKKMHETTLWKRKLLEARKNKDEKLLAKLEKKREYMEKIDAEIASKQLKVTLITIIPSFLSFYFLSTLYGVNAVALMPKGMSIPFLSHPDGGLPFFTWYLLTFFAIYNPLSKLFKVSIGVEDYAEESIKNKK
jgi:uncharacterized membrane protein (DUF106 family)